MSIYMGAQTSGTHHSAALAKKHGLEYFQQNGSHRASLAYKSAKHSSPSPAVGPARKAPLTCHTGVY